MKLLETRPIKGANVWSKSCESLILIYIDTPASHLNQKRIKRFLESSTFKEHIVPDFVCKDLSVKEAKPIEFAFLSVILLLLYTVDQIVTFKKINSLSGSNIKELIFDCVHAEDGILAVDGAFKIINRVIHGNKSGLNEELKRFSNKLHKNQAGQLTSSILKAASDKDIPIYPIRFTNAIQLGEGGYQKRILKSFTNFTGIIGVKFSSNKDLTKKLLNEMGVPVPTGIVIGDLNELDLAIQKINYPIVIKPLSGNNGRGVSVNVTNIEDAHLAFVEAKRISTSGLIIVERYIDGFDYRLLVINNKFIAAAKRSPPIITGDGTTTIGELIEETNRDPKRGEGHSKPMTNILIDHVTQKILADKGLSVNSILKAGDSLLLKRIANISAGGSSEDVTDIIHPDNILAAERVAKIIGLDVCGMDVITPDIRIPFIQNNAAIVEVNSAPGFRLHIEPSYGPSRKVADNLIDMLFPPGIRCVIPAIAVLSSKTHISLGVILEDLFTEAGYNIGYSFAEGIRVQKVKLKFPKKSYQERSELLIKDPTVDMAVYDTLSDEIMKYGAGLKKFDIAIRLHDQQSLFLSLDKDVHNDFQVDKIFIDNTLKKGICILQADHPFVDGWEPSINPGLALLNMDINHKAITTAIENGVTAAYIENGNLIVNHEQTILKVLDQADMPERFFDSTSLYPSVLMSAALCGVIYNIDIHKIRACLLRI